MVIDKQKFLISVIITVLACSEEMWLAALLH